MDHFGYLSLCSAVMGSAASEQPKAGEEQALYLQWLLADDERVRGAFTPIWAASVQPGADHCARADLEAALQSVSTRLGRGVVRLGTGGPLNEEAALSIFRWKLTEYANSSAAYENELHSSHEVSAQSRIKTALRDDQTAGLTLPRTQVLTSQFP